MYASSERSSQHVSPVRFNSEPVSCPALHAVPPGQNSSTPFGGSLKRSRAGMKYRPAQGVCLAQNPDWTNATYFMPRDEFPSCPGLRLAMSASSPEANGDWRMEMILATDKPDTQWMLFTFAQTVVEVGSWASTPLEAVSSNYQEIREKLSRPLYQTLC